MTLIRVIALLLLVLGVAAPEAIGALSPDYNPQSDYLSELGAVGAPYAALMNYAVFLPVGAAFAVATFLLWRQWPGARRPNLAALLLLGSGVSYIGAAFYPCDPGCPAEGSTSQFMHNALGVIGYLTTPPALALLGAAAFVGGKRLLGALTIAAAALYAAGFLAMASDDDGALLGAWQRLADYTLFVWLFAAGWLIGGADRRAVQ